MTLLLAAIVADSRRVLAIDVCAAAVLRLSADIPPNRISYRRDVAVPHKILKGCAIAAALYPRSRFERSYWLVNVHGGVPHSASTTRRSVYGQYDDDKSER